MSILSFTAARPAARPAQTYRTSDGAAAVVAFAQDDEPVESFVRIAGQRFKVLTWTADQWDRLPREDRPPLAWPHGDLIAAVLPA